MNFPVIHKFFKDKTQRKPEEKFPSASLFGRDYWPTLRDTRLYQIMHISIQKPFIKAYLDYAIMYINASANKENPIITPKTRQKLFGCLR